jgi:hypothetical protein
MISSLTLEEVNNQELEVTKIINSSTNLLDDNDNSKDLKDKKNVLINHGNLNFDVDELINSFELF